MDDGPLSVCGSVTVGSFRLDVDLEAAAGQVLAVLGPNGAGKSTLLRVVAGLAALDRGQVRLGDEVLDDPSGRHYVPAARRRIGVVFSDHRLFPHLRAQDNVAFGLRAQGVTRREARREAALWLDRVGIGHLARRPPRQMSGGESQRVALARALAGQPRALLLDEPLAALDVQTRAEVQGELRRHLAEFPGPVLLVTHDPVEALLLAGRIVVLEDGRIVQQGTAAAVTARPATPYVARLVGVNLYAGVAAQGRVTLTGGGVLVVAEAPDGPVLVTVRPSAFTVFTEPPPGSSARNVWTGQVTALAPLGDRIRISVAGAQPVLVDLTAAAVAELGVTPGEPVWLTAKATDLTAYPAPVAGSGA